MFIWDLLCTRHLAWDFHYGISFNLTKPQPNRVDLFVCFVF